MITVIGGGRGWFSLDTTGLGLDEAWWYEEVVPLSAAAEDISLTATAAASASDAVGNHDVRADE